MPTPRTALADAPPPDRGPSSPRPRGRRAARAFAAAALASSLAACLAADDAPPGAAEADGPSAESGSRLVGSNGLRENGLRENGLRENGLRENGLSTLAFKAWFDKDRALGDNVMTYVAKCALGPAQTLRYTDGAGKTYAWPGSLGLAPAWATRAATVPEQEWVSACLMAFTNKCGNQVTVSLRGPTEGAPEVERFPLEAGEREGWTYQEAAFFGNLFTTPNDANACEGQGGQSQAQMGLGRECGSDVKNCGFESQGACATACTRAQNADGYYKSCSANGRTYSRVITTYLDPVTWRGAMDCRNQGLDDDRLTAGGYHVCARASSGQPMCWGQNEYGQVGDGTTLDRYVPTPVKNLTKAVQFTAGWGGTCARREDGSTACWGASSDNRISPPKTPQTVTGLANSVYSSGGGSTTCTLVQGGAVHCWGVNRSGQCGRPPTTDTVAPGAPVPGIANAVEVANGNEFACARLADNTVRCWGLNFEGQLGKGSLVPDVSYTPVAVAGLTDVVQLSAGDSHTCARLASGTVKCWGSNFSGQLGDGTLTGRTRPVLVSGLTGVVKIAAGLAHTCALKANGNAVCWGWNGMGQLGNGTTVDRATPAAVVDLTGIEDLAAGAVMTCARRSTGQLSCWGENWFGQLGIGTADGDPHPRPLAVKNLP